MKTITWSEFVALVAKGDNIVKVDNIEVGTNTHSNAVNIYWEADGEQWHFTFEKDKNECIEVEGNSAVVFCNEYDVDAFNFEFFNLIPVTI
jgi:hypothetical protein